jgi:lactoylglutathione lyase
MVLNHLNLTVDDLERSKEFLVKYFGLTDQGGNRKMTFLQDENGLVLTLMKAAEKAEVRYPGSFHIGFIVESKEKVNSINDMLKSEGFDVPSPKKYHAWTFYFQAPGGFTIEVMSAN